MEEKPFFIKLPNRGQITITGEDRFAFLQNLITNDVTLLESTPCIYTCLLTAQGKFLHDFFVRQRNNSLFLDCEGGERAENLLKKLKMYKLRSKIDLFCEKNVDIYAIFGKKSEKTHPDPRNSDMGVRFYDEKPENTKEKPFEEWDQQRIRLGIPDGSRDMVVERSTLAEAHIDKLNGISFDKGCYVGQEIVTRMHSRGLAKKHLYPVKITGPASAPGTDIHINGIHVGEMRSSCGNIGIALLKDAYLDLFKNSPIRPL